MQVNFDVGQKFFMLEMPVKQPSRGAPAEMRSNKSSDTERAKDEGGEEEGKSGKRTKLSVCNVEISGGAFVQFFVCVAGVFGCGVTHDFVRITHTYLCRDRVNGGEGGREGGCGE